VPPIALRALNDFLRPAFLASPTPPDQDEFFIAVLGAVGALIENHEDTKQVLYEAGFNDTLHALFRSDLCPRAFLPSCNLVHEYCRETAQTQTSNNSFTRCRKLGEESCLVPTLIAQLKLDRLSRCVPVLEALGAVCVNDAICLKAMREGVLEIAIAHVAAGGVKASILPSLSFIRQLCMVSDVFGRFGYKLCVCDFT
jgi:hypothetical protein